MSSCTLKTSDLDTVYLQNYYLLYKSSASIIRYLASKFDIKFDFSVKKYL